MIKIKIEIEYETLEGKTSTFENFAGVRGACDWIESIYADAMLEETRVEQNNIEIAERDEHLPVPSDVEPDAYVEKKSEGGIM